MPKLRNRVPSYRRHKRSGLAIVTLEGTQSARQARLSDEEKSPSKSWSWQHRWHPHQLRHNDATRIRKEFGLEAARIILGHRSPAVTEVYAERDYEKAEAVIMQIG